MTPPVSIRFCHQPVILEGLFFAFYRPFNGWLWFPRWIQRGNLCLSPLFQEVLPYSSQINFQHNPIFQHCRIFVNRFDTYFKKSFPLLPYAELLLSSEDSLKAEKLLGDTPFQSESLSPYSGLQRALPLNSSDMKRTRVSPVSYFSPWTIPQGVDGETTRGARGAETSQAPRKGLEASDGSAAARVPSRRMAPRRESRSRLNQRDTRRFPRW